MISGKISPKINRSYIFCWFLLFSQVISSFFHNTIAQAGTNEKILTFAQKFINEKSMEKKGVPFSGDLTTVYVSPDTAKTKLFAINTGSSGFVLVADYNDSRFAVAYSLNSSVDGSMKNPGFKALLDFYEETSSVSVASHEPDINKGTKAPSTPLLDIEAIKWGQGSFFNLECPYDATADVRTPVGCVAVTMGQIMRYYKFPLTGKGSISYNSSKYGTISADFGNTTYQWNDMPADPTEASPAISKLLYHCGVGAKMNYGYLLHDGVLMSGAYSSDALIAFQSFFKYKNASHIIWSDYYYYPDVYFDLLRNEISQGRPVFYELGPGTAQSFGHTVVMDGFDGNYFHLNFGWQGSDDGYYLLDGFQSANVYDFYMRGSSIVGLSPSTIKANPQDSLALVALYNSTNGPSWTNKNGWLEAPLNQWRGITMAGGRVIEINLSQNGLNGTIPSQIWDLTSLISIELGSNSITGVLPKEIGKLVNLRHLEMKTCRLSGSIPSEIGNLLKLQTLDLVNNNLSGSIPESLYNLTDLRRLALGANKLTGSLSPAAGQLVRLVYLSIWSNQLSGPIPSETGNLVNLTELELAGNQFSGELPPSLGNLVNLTSFTIANNLFEGSIPDEICNLTKLTAFNISNNNISALPENIGQMVLLQSIEASGNKLTGVPASISSLTKLYRLYLQGNLITSLPDLGTMPALWDLNLSNNLLEDLPESFGEMLKVSDLNLSNNRIKSLPSSLENLSTLKRLSLNDNRLASVPVSFSFLINLIELYLNKNTLSGPLPPMGHLKLLSLDLRNNQFLFEDIASSLMPDDTVFTDSYEFSYWDQAKVKLTDSLFNVSAGDSVAIDIRRISRLSHPKNTYEWYRGNDLVQVGPVLIFSSFKEENSGKYICQIRNKAYRKLLVLETPSIEIGTSVVDPFEGSFIIESGSLGKPEISDNIIMLVPDENLRGTITWQASADMKEWINVATNPSSNLLKDSKVKLTGNNITLEPSAQINFRYLVKEDNCDAVISDTIKVKPYGITTIDTMLNVRNKTVTITTDSIEITIPENITSEDFEITVKKVTEPPAMPPTVIPGTVYDVTASFGSVFDIPLVIRLKNIDKEKFRPENIDKYKAVYYDDAEQKWIPFEKGALSLQDSTIVFETNHLTKLSWWLDEAAVWGYTDMFIRNNIRVFYKDADTDMMKFIYGKSQSAQAWHLSSSDPEYGTPLLVQDIAYFLNEVKTKFSSLGLEVPAEMTTVYVKQMDDAGNVGIMGMINNYLNINRDTDNPKDLMSLLAHEYMHYTQDYYISAHAGNIFWMEANAHLADRMVWDDSTIPVSESDNYMLDGRSASNSIFQFLSNSWDYWDKGILTQNNFGNVFFCYQAGTFIHYMRSYREGTKLKPEELLKETSYSGSWLDYLDSFIKDNLNSTVGDQYEEFIKYIFEGSNKNFTLLNTIAEEDPLKYLKMASNSFTTNKYIKFKYGNSRSLIKDTVNLNLPYLSTKMVQFFNLNNDRAVVKMIRKSDASENNKVYLVRYNNLSKKMTFEDLSDKDSTNFMIESSSGINKINKKNIAYLLFINKDKSQAFSENYDLEYYAVPDFNYFDDFGFFYKYSWSTISSEQAKVNVFTDGQTETTDEFIVMAMAYRMYADVYNSQISYSSNLGDEVLETYASSDYIDQTVTYNFIKGEMTIRNKENSAGTSSTAAINTREMTIVLSNVWLTPYDYFAFDGQSKYSMTTDNTAETQKIIKSISYVQKWADYNWEEHRHNPVETKTYLRTNFNENNIILHMQFY